MTCSIVLSVELTENLLLVVTKEWISPFNSVKDIFCRSCLQGEYEKLMKDGWKATCSGNFYIVH